MSSSMSSSSSPSGRRCCCSSSTSSSSGSSSTTTTTSAGHSESTTETGGQTYDTRPHTSKEAKKQRNKNILGQKYKKRRHTYTDKHAKREIQKRARIYTPAPQNYKTTTTTHTHTHIKAIQSFLISKTYMCNSMQQTNQRHIHTSHIQQQRQMDIRFVGVLPVSEKQKRTLLHLFLCLKTNSINKDRAKP